MINNSNFDYRAMFFSKRLTQAMDMILHVPLTIIEAPMGYGKTTAIREYLNRTEVRQLWQTVYDSYSDNFWADFCSLIAEIDASSAQCLQGIGVPNDNISRQETVRIMKSIDFPVNTVIVIDDYHLIKSEWIDDLISIFAKNSIKNLHMVITTRLAVLDNIEELKLKKIAQHITKNELEMTPSDIAHYCKLCGITLDPEEIKKLYAYTEGWISAIYMILLDLSKSITASHQKITWDTIHPTDIYGLLENTVYAALSLELQDFLQTICIFDNFTEEQALYMWGKDNTSKLLNELISKNTFITYDKKNKTYQMHNILTNYLKEIFAKRDESYRKNNHAKAAQWFLQQKDAFRAMHHAYTAHAFSDLLKAVELDMGRNMNLERKDIIIEYFQTCPQSILAKHPLAILIYALSLVTFTEMELFFDICTKFPDYIQHNDEMDASTKHRFMGEFEVLLSMTEFNDINKMFNHHQKAWALLEQPISFMDTQGGWWTFGSPSVLYLFYRESAHLEQNVIDLHTALPLYNKLASGHGSGGEYVMAGERHFNLGQFQDAQINAHSALAAAITYSQPEVLVCALFLQARLSIISCDFKQIIAIFERMRNEIRQRNTYFLLHTIDIAEGFIYAGLGQYEKIPSWIAQGELQSNHVMFPTLGFGNIIYGRSMLLTGDYLKLLGLAEQFIEIASVYPNLIAQIYTYIHISAANEKIFRSENSLTALKQALDIAMPDQLYMPFVENCDFIRSILERLLPDNTYSSHVAKILALFDEYAIAITYIIKSEFEEEKPNLTPRELEIALLAAKGMSNTEIAEHLFVSSNTIKTQLKNIFIKLDITSRALLKQKLPEITD